MNRPIANVCRRLVTAGLVTSVLSASGCILAEPAGDFPFSPVVTLQDGGQNNGVEPDMPMLPPPQLVFTEVMLDAPGSDATVGERGEFVEIKNIGEGPADPREIVLFVTNLDTLTVNRLRVEEPFLPEEQAVYDGLQPITEGSYFVFVRHEDPALMDITSALPDGSFYDYGKFGNGAPFPHQGLALYQLDLGYRYPDNTTEIFDTIRWSEHDFFAGSNSMMPLVYPEGKSVSVRSAAEGSDLNDETSEWCVSVTENGDGFGSPGAPSGC